jgi:hypothetical protein
LRLKNEAFQNTGKSNPQQNASDFGATSAKKARYLPPFPHPHHAATPPHRNQVLNQNQAAERFWYRGQATHELVLGNFLSLQAPARVGQPETRLALRTAEERPFVLQTKTV